MNKLTLVCFSVAFACLGISCKKDENEPAKEALIVDKTSITLAGHTDAISSFTIQYSGSWTIAKNPSTASWLNVTPTSGNGNATVHVITTENNMAGPARSAALAITPDGDESRRVNITVIQSIFTAPATSVTWSKLFGGTLYEVFNVIQPTPEGGYIVAGYGESVDGDLISNHGNSDVFVVKMDAAGNALWKKTYGGTEAEQAHAMIPANDGGYIIVGSARSKNGDVTNHRLYDDVWVLKIDGNGNLLWQKTYGGSGSEVAYSIISTPDNGYLVGASTDSRDGDVTNLHFDPNFPGAVDDFWLLKLDISGNLVWQKTYGGNWDEVCYSVTRTPDGGFMATGFSNATTTSGDVQTTRGDKDIWVIKTDAVGNLLWQKTYGGSKSDYARKVLSLADGYILSGGTESNDGQVTGNHGSMDAWIVKIDLTGNLVWQKAFGGKWYENAWHLARDGNNFVFTADAESNDGDLVGNTDSDGSWIVKIDPNGTIIWQEVFGGSHDDDPARWIIVNPDNSYTAAANTRSSNGDVPPGNHGFFDGWVFTIKK
jgi:hypothetical protein